MRWGEVEVLAPAGRVSDIIPLLENGADAVYAGLSGFSARPKSSDFSMEDIREILPVIHDRGKKLFIAINANVPGDRTKELYASVAALDALFADAVIVSDYGLMRRISGILKHTELHASTLSGIYNYEDVRMLKDMGVKRIILSSDLFVDEMVDIIDRVPDMDYEIVADGGICFNSNRQCLLPHFGQKENYTVYCQMEYELLQDGEAVGKAKRIGNFPGKIHRTMGIYMGMGISSFKVEGRTNEIGYILPRVREMAESKKFYQDHLSEIPGMMHYIRRNIDYGDRAGK